MSGGFVGYQRARISARNPRSIARCDRCSFVWNLNTLRFQYYYQGPTLQNTGFLVCRDCLDLPNEQTRTIVLPPDPLPVLNPRIEDYAQEIPNFFVDEVSEDSFISEDGLHFVSEDTLPDGYPLPFVDGFILMQSDGYMLTETGQYIELE